MHQLSLPLLCETVNSQFKVQKKTKTHLLNFKKNVLRIKNEESVVKHFETYTGTGVNHKGMIMQIHVDDHSR